MKKYSLTIGLTLMFVLFSNCDSTSQSRNDSVNGKTDSSASIDKVQSPNDLSAWSDEPPIAGKVTYFSWGGDGTTMHIGDYGLYCDNLSFPKGYIDNDCVFKQTNDGNFYYSYTCKDCPEEYRFEERYIQKNDVNSGTYEANQLPAKWLDSGVTFKAKDGNGYFRFFRSDSKNHTFGGQAPTADLQRPIVVEYLEYDFASDEDEIVEVPLEEENGYVKLYDISNGSLTSGCEIKYTKPEKYSMKNVYTKNGDLTVNMRKLDKPYKLPIAYVHSEQAIFYDGSLYYREK